ncbi:MAG TPA: hypothetical protein VF618_11180 [Thermoanaerobaculia bacterium]
MATRSLVSLALSLVFALSSLAADSEHTFVTTIAGQPGVAGSADGSTATASFNRPTWLDVVRDREVPRAALPGDVYVIDRVNDAIRQISGNSVTTLKVARGYWDLNTIVQFDFGGPFGGGIAVEPPNGSCGSGPWDRGFFVAATGSQQLALVSPYGMLAARDDVSPVIGTGAAGAADGNDVTSRFNNPSGIALSWDYGRQSAYGRAMFVADSGNHTIRRVGFTLSFEACPQAKIITTLAGSAGVAGAQDGRGAEARFNAPRGVATGPDGSVYVADSGNHTIRRVALDGTVTTIAGAAGIAGSNDGPALEARLNTPSGIDVNAAGEVFIADTGNHTIRKLTTDGSLITIAGTPGVGGFADGSTARALFNGPVGLKIAPDGALLVADTSNNVIRRIGGSPARRRGVGR